jgi:excisionase family DNA binding protein
LSDAEPRRLGGNLRVVDPYNAKNTCEDSESLLTKRELAPRLRIAVRTLDDWMGKNRVPYIKVGKTVRFRWSDVVQKLAAYRVN